MLPYNITEFTFLVFFLSLSPLYTLKVNKYIPGGLEKNLFKEQLRFTLGSKESISEELNECFCELQEVSEKPSHPLGTNIEQKLVWSWEI